MSYDGMEVTEGNEAGLAWEMMLYAEAGSEQRRRLRDGLPARTKPLGGGRFPPEE
jgi:hypothetical protein